jgi:phosphoglycolate phosphatase
VKVPFAVLFDFDGTLVDSAPGILASLARTLRRHGLEPQVPLTQSLVGPPLAEMLKRITGLMEGHQLDELAEGFRLDYDDSCCSATKSYPGISRMLEELSARRIGLGIVTNKRLAPTMALLDALDWRRWFSVVATLDAAPPSISSKGTLLASTLSSLGREPRLTPYVGDRWQDGQAANSLGMPFVAVHWGYGDWSEHACTPPDWRFAANTEELLDQLNACRH